MRRWPAFLAVLTMSGVGAAAAQPNVIPNATFDAPAVSWWQGPIQASSSKSWSSFGNPGGSLLLESTLQPPSVVPIELRGPCISGPAGAWLYRGQVLNASDQAGEECLIVYVRYEDATCSGPPIFDFIDDGPQPLGVWIDREAVPLAIDDTIRSFQPTLLMSRSPTPGASRCYFDNLELLSPGVQVVEVPALSPLAMWILAGLLLIVGLRRLGRGAAPGASSS